jgi:hypothetical protein
MTPKTWKSCLGVLCLLAAGTANAAKISFSEKGFIDVGGLVQAQYRIEQDAAGSGKDPSHDFLLRRARLIIAGQYDEHISFLVDTDVSYGAVSTATGSNSTATSTATAWNNNFYLLDAVATYKVGKEFMIDAGLQLLPESHNELTSGARYATVNNFPTFFSANSQRATRDVGVQIRGLLLEDRLYYRLGVFNGVQSVATAGTALGLNPGDAPRLAGMLRFNIFGKEDGYAFCQMCFATSPIVSVGVAGDFQANSIRGSVPTGATTPNGTTGMTSYTAGNADIFADIPFPGDMELSVDVQGTKVWAGKDTAVSGWGAFGMVSFRFGPIGPYFQIEHFDSESKYVGATRVPPSTTTTTNYAGDLTTYRGGISWYIEKHTYKISAEIAFQDKENADVSTSVGTPPVVIGTVPKNHWVGTLQFQAGF